MRKNHVVLPVQLGRFGFRKLPSEKVRRVVNGRVSVPAYTGIRVGKCGENDRVHSVVVQFAASSGEMCETENGVATDAAVGMSTETQADGFRPVAVRRVHGYNDGNVSKVFGVAAFDYSLDVRFSPAVFEWSHMVGRTTEGFYDTASLRS